MTYEEAIETYPPVEHMGAVDLAIMRHHAIAAGDIEFKDAIDAVMKWREENL